MKKVFLILCGLTLVCGSIVGAHAQQVKTVAGEQNPVVVRDPDLEKESLHNLEVARHYYKLKKAYRAAVARCEEVIAGDPTFSRLDEILYIAGMSSLRLSENRGKQSATLPADKLRDDAREYLSRIVHDFPESAFRKEAEEKLQAVGGLKAKTEQQ